jgi:hypothetical protein
MTAHRVFIDGVPQAIMAERLVRNGNEATLEHPLPFLTLGTAVSDEHGHTYVIRSVELQMSFAGVPRLVVGLDPETSAVRKRQSVRARKQETITYERPRSLQDEAVREVVVMSERPTASLPAPVQIPIPVATASARLLASAPPALHTGTTMELDRPNFLERPSVSFFRRLMAEIRSVWHEIAVELGLHTESRRVR